MAKQNAKNWPANRRTNGSDSPRIAVVTCAVLEQEVIQIAHSMPQVVHVELLEQGLHNEPVRLRSTVQQAVSRVEQNVDCDAIVLGYGLCSRGTEGITTTRARLVITRAHDCITILLGSKERYANYVAKHPGTYWYSLGWNKHVLMPGKARYEKLKTEYVEKYGEDNAEYLMENEQHWFTTYDRAAFVELTIAKTDDSSSANTSSESEAQLQYTKQCADWLGWRFDHQQGDPDLLTSLLSGNWDEDRFVVLEPGQTIEMTPDARVLRVVDVSAERRSDRNAS